jgi:UPF0755 protein
MSHGPPPVPGGRTPEEREVARREREARRSGKVAPPRQSSDGEARYSAERTREQLRALRERTGGPGPAAAVRVRRGRLVVAAVAALLALGVAWFLVSLLQPFKGDGEGRGVRVLVPRGASVGQIGELLERRGVVASSFFFETRARLSGRSADLKPGSYRFKRDMSYGAVLGALERGAPPDIVVLTIPEGRSRREVARSVDGQLEGSYLAATRRSRALDPSEYGARNARDLEGFLFPATYELKRSRPMSALVEQQLSAFRQQFERVDLGYARRKNLTPYEVLIIASLVEREAAVAKERGLIASVIYNRLREEIPLGIDATVRYVTGNWDRPLRESELANPSPYNTRRNPGLPPGPIGSPGIDSIRAAARPARSDYLFYVVKPGTCGEHDFSKTDAEFQRDVARYNRERERRGGKSPTNC